MEPQEIKFSKQVLKELSSVLLELKEKSLTEGMHGPNLNLFIIKQAFT